MNFRKEWQKVAEECYLEKFCSSIKAASFSDLSPKYLKNLKQVFDGVSHIVPVDALPVAAKQYQDEILDKLATYNGEMENYATAVYNGFQRLLRTDKRPNLEAA